MDPAYWKQKFLYPFLVKEDLEPVQKKSPMRVSNTTFSQSQTLPKSKC